MLAPTGYITDSNNDEIKDYIFATTLVNYTQRNLIHKLVPAQLSGIKCVDSWLAMIDNDNSIRNEIKAYTNMCIQLLTSKNAKSYRFNLQHRLETNEVVHFFVADRYAAINADNVETIYLRDYTVSSETVRDIIVDTVEKGKRIYRAGNTVTIEESDTGVKEYKALIEIYKD